MTETVIVRSQQTQLDITMQNFGSVEALFDLLLSNDISMTEELSPGQMLTIAESEKTNSLIVRYYQNNNILPGTANDQEFGGFDFVQDAAVSTAVDNDLTTLLSYQSYLDIAIQETGTIESLIEMALNNDFNIGSTPDLGIQIDASSTLVNEAVLNYYKLNGIVPATGLMVDPYEGLRYAVEEYAVEEYWV